MTLSSIIWNSLGRGLGLAALALTLSACADEGTAGDASPEEGTPLYFEPIGYGHRASLSDTIEVVARDREDWLSIRDSLSPTMPFDSVDFNQAVVLLAALPQTISGYSIEFTSVEERDSVVVAEYLVNAPSDDCLTAFADLVPFQAVLVRRTEQPVEFERVVEEYRCTIGPRRR